MGDLSVNLTPKDDRKRASHAIALDIRKRLKDLPLPAARLARRSSRCRRARRCCRRCSPRSTAPTRRRGARPRRACARRSNSVDFVVDVDDSYGVPTERLRFAIDQEALEYHGVEEQAVYDTLGALIGGTKVGYSQRGAGLKPILINVALPRSRPHARRAAALDAAARRRHAAPGRQCRTWRRGQVKREPSSFPIFRHNGRYAEMVTAELAGRFEAPIYGMLAVDDALGKVDWGAAGKPEIALHGQPLDESKPTLLWDGEWEVTYVTFRDMGAAFGVAILGIYLLVVAQFGSFTLPLVVLTPVPLTLIGIVLGHWALGAPFTATSMIGFIALAGIIVRNSILLVDFIRSRRAQGAALRPALIEAGATRFKPIVLTAAAAMIGAAFILTDPIFQGLAISLVFGLASSTALTLLVIPAIYVVLRDDAKRAVRPAN